MWLALLKNIMNRHFIQNRQLPASNAFLYRRLIYADFPYPENLRKRLLVTYPQTPEIILPDISHKFFNASLWATAFDSLLFSGMVL